MKSNFFFHFVLALLVALIAVSYPAAGRQPRSGDCKDWIVLDNLYCNGSYVDYVKNVTIDACLAAQGDIMAFGESLVPVFQPEGKSTLNMPDVKGIYFDIIFVPDRCLLAFDLADWHFNVVWPGADTRINPGQRTEVYHVNGRRQ